MAFRRLGAVVTVTEAARREKVMVRRPTMDEVRPVAELFLAASAEQGSGEDAVRAARLWTPSGVTS
jgi:hypothetical protein